MLNGVLSPVISRNHSTSLFCPPHWLPHLCFSEEFYFILFNSAIENHLWHWQGKFWVGTVVYSVLLFLVVPFNCRMHSASSHDGHKHHRSQTLPIIRGKNALSNPKLLQMIDSSTASKYRNYLLPSGILWDLDQDLYRPFLDQRLLKQWDWSHLSHFPVRFLPSFEDEQRQWGDVLTSLVQLVRVDPNFLPFHLLWAVFFKIPLWLKVQLGQHLCCDET